MLSTGVSAVLGLAFWLVAARHYSQEAVGQGSAAVAAMRLLASITATTMIGAVVRFVPRAGRATGSLVLRAYAVSSLVVTAAGIVFLLTLDLWGPSYAPLGTPVAGALFVASCVAWAILTLQDGVLTGLREALWVPIGNAVFSLGKLILLILLAGAMPVLGVFVSWGAAIALSTVPLGWLVFRRLIPRQAAADHRRRPPTLRAIGRFVAGDSVGAMFSLLMINLLPVMVAVRLGAVENGYFYVAYTVGGTMEFLAINMASSLTAHASRDPRALAEGVRGALRRMALLLVPVVAVLAAFAPLVLAPFGEDYADRGAMVLRLLAAAALPRVAVELYIGVLRVAGRTAMLALVQGVMCVLVLGSAALLLTPAGIDGAGWGVLLSMTVVALMCVPGLRAALRGEARAGADLADTPPYGTRWARLRATGGGDAPARGEGAAGRASEGRGSAVPGGGAAYGGAVYGRALARARAPLGPRGERRLRIALWWLLGSAGVFYAAALRHLPWPAADDRSVGARTGAVDTDRTAQEILAELPGIALAAAVLMLLVYVAALTLCAPADARLASAALATLVVALYSAPLALGTGPPPGRVAWWAGTADGALAEVLRPAPYAFLALALIPLWLVLRWALRLPGETCWWLLWPAAVLTWALRDTLAPAAPGLLAALLLFAVAGALARRGGRDRPSVAVPHLPRVPRQGGEGGRPARSDRADGR
ncbi:lipopolysaccharide biosynthesis protein [Streptomyces abyssomicinicus]|uniref:lipopolysaccharide biosynthesis protein n=1 Tax=Streptomyces abyssomicinicus TaxID=574929 RepID=UPI001FED14FE|nr:lipopolysaccharide biosynthesis protein [Streptomyces abyssomicinicus]